jgi:hypothetical protein
VRQIGLGFLHLPRHSRRGAGAVGTSPERLHIHGQRAGNLLRTARIAADLVPVVAQQLRQRLGCMLLPARRGVLVMDEQNARGRGIPGAGGSC